MRFPTFLLPLAVLLAAFSCGKTPDEPADPEHVTLTVLDKAVSCWSDSEEGTVRFRSDGKWQAETDETWISVVTGSGRGSGEEQTLRFRLSPNQTDSDRTGILTLFTKDGYQTILVTQLSIADRSVSHHFRDVLAGDFSRVYICAHRANTYEGVYMTKDCPENSVPAIRNVWELTAPEMKGNVIFKNPEAEKVNMNFLIMCTEPAWAEKLAEAYRDWKGTDIDLGSFENAGYKWVAEFLDNVTFGKSDTSIAEELSQKTAAGKIGLFVLSKLRSSSVLTENLTVAQYDASANGYAIEPFSGFMYPMYTMVNTKATRPYTAMLFIEYLMSQEGFAPWGKSIGSYSPNPAFTVNEGDLSIDVWKANLVMEDANYILDSFEVEDFILQHCQK